MADSTDQVREAEGETHVRVTSTSAERLNGHVSIASLAELKSTILFDVGLSSVLGCGGAPNSQNHVLSRGFWKSVLQQRPADFS